MPRSGREQHPTQRALAWARRRRTAPFTALIALGAALWLLGGRVTAALPSATALPGAAAPSATAPAAGTFRLTDQQLRSITIEPVVSIKFHSEEITDGKIAYNGDALTPVYSPYSGRVTRVLAALGAAVRKGEPLFELEASEYAQAESDLLSAAARVKLDSINEQRKHAQYDAHGGSLQDWQEAQNDLSASRAALAAVRNRLRILGRSDGQIDAIIAQSKPDARVAAVAPIAGVVVDRQIGPGQFVQAGAATPVYTIADLSTVWLVANVREADAARVRVGQSMTVQVLALPDRVFKAHLSHVGPAVDPASRRVPVYAVIQNPDHLLKNEMFATFAIATSPDSLASAVPREAVIYEGETARVWVLRTEHDVELRAVRLGRVHEDWIEVLQGLVAGERVVTRGALFIDRAASGN